MVGMVETATGKGAIRGGEIKGEDNENIVMPCHFHCATGMNRLGGEKNDI